MASMDSLDMFTEGEQFDARKLQEKMSIVQKEREKLAEILKNWLNQYAQGDKDGFMSNSEAEVSRLSNAEILKNRLNQYAQGDKDGFMSHFEADLSRRSNIVSEDLSIMLDPLSQAIEELQVLEVFSKVGDHVGIKYFPIEPKKHLTNGHQKKPQ